MTRFLLIETIGVINGGGRRQKSLSLMTSCVPFLPLQINLQHHPKMIFLCVIQSPVPSNNIVSLPFLIYSMFYHKKNFEHFVTVWELHGNVARSINWQITIYNLNWTLGNQGNYGGSDCQQYRGYLISISTTATTIKTQMIFVIVRSARNLKK